MEEEDINSNSSPGPVQKKTFRSITSQPKQRPFREYTQASNNRSFYNTGYGKSKYDKGFNFDASFDENDPLGSINEHRANEQSGIAQLGLGAVRATSKALTEVAKLPGVIGGILASPFVEDGEGMDMAFNNAWIRTFDNLNKDINTELLPVYTAKAVKEGNLWDNISSTSFWATDGADGVGFIAAMFVPGAIFEYAGLGGKLINGLSKSAKYAGMVEKTEAGVSALKYMGITGKNIDSGLAVMGNTIFEAGAEAKGVGDSLDGKKDEFIQKESLKILADLDNQRRNGQITIEQYNELSKNASLKAEEIFKEQRALAMRDTFVSNVGVLLGPNAIMHKAIWGKAGKTFVKETEESLLKRTGNSLNRVGKAFASEGFFEEGSQTTIEKMFVDKALNKELGKNNDFSIGEFTKEYVNTLSTTDGQKAIFLGGVLGGPMMSYQGRKSDVENRKQANTVLDGIQSQITHFNDTFDTEIYKKDGNGNFLFKENSTERILDNKKVVEVARALNFTEQQSNLFDLAVQTGNTQVVEQLKQQAIFNMILPSIHNGEMGIQALEQKLNEDSKFNEIVEKDKTADEKDKSKTFIKETLETAKYLQKENQKFQDFSKDIIELKSNKATPEQKQEFLNKLNASYLNVKHELRQNEKSLKELEDKKTKLLEELNINPNLNSDNILDNGRLLQDYKNKSPLLVKTLEDINEKTSSIEKAKKDISDIWQSKLIDEYFNEYVEEDIKLEELTSEENVQKHEDVVSQIKSIKSKEDLLKYVKKLPQEFKENIHIQEVLDDHLKLLNEQKRIQEEIKRVENFEKDKQKFENDSFIGTETKPETKESIGDQILKNGLKTLQTSDIAEVNSDDNIFDENPNKVIELDERTNPLNVSKNQGASRIISTNQETGEPLFDKLKEFVKYEKESRNKTNDKVTFSLGDVNSKDLSFTANAIFERLKKNENLTKDEIKYLEDYLPIKVTLSNGTKSASSFIDSMTSKSNKIVEVETLPLRKAIVSALIENKGDFNGIEGKVNKQFTGELKLGEQNSNILDLDVFKDMSEDDKIKYFKKNTVYVSNKGEVKYTSNDVTDETKSLSANNKGEVFLKIPMINGEMFYLKLNINRLTQEKAESVLDLIILRSNVLNKQQEFTSEELESYINNNLPNLKTEFEFIKRNNDSIDITLERLVNFVVYSQNTNAKTKLILGKDGTLALGELLHKVNVQIPEWSGQLESYTYTTDTLNNLNDNQKQAIVEYLKYKRHNVLITKDNTATFNNDDYIKYLLGLNSDYSVLTTNAIVNEPTFQGYSNIYLNQSVNNTKAKKEVKSESIEEINYENPEDLLASLQGQFGDDVVQTIIPITPPEVIPQQDIEHELIGKEITAKEPTTKELIKGKVISVNINKIKKGQFRLILDNNEIVAWNESNPSNFTWVKKNNSKPTQILKSDNLQDIFKTSDAKTKARIVMVTAKQLGMTDKVNPKDMENSFNELYKELKDNETSQKEIKKICGF